MVVRPVNPGALADREPWVTPMPACFLGKRVCLAARLSHILAGNIANGPSNTVAAVEHSSSNGLAPQQSQAAVRRGGPRSFRWNARLLPGALRREWSCTTSAAAARPSLPLGVFAALRSVSPAAAPFPPPRICTLSVTARQNRADTARPDGWPPYAPEVHKGGPLDSCTSPPLHERELRGPASLIPATHHGRLGVLGPGGVLLRPPR